MLNNIPTFPPKHLITAVCRGILGTAILGMFVFVGLHTAINKPPTPLKTEVTKSTSQTHTTTPKVVTHTTTPTPTTTTPTPSVKTTTPVTTPAVTTPKKTTPVVVPAPGSSVSSLTPAPTPPSGSGSGSSGSSSGTTTSYTSTNWSGYMATTGTFSTISGAWNATTPTGNGSTTTADGTWIGIGGVSSDDLIQVGTDNTVSAGGHVTATAFYEMLPAASEPIATITVTPGDSMTASITKGSGNQWTITITDKTDNESYTNTVTYASTESSAEWIEEDPSYTETRQIPFDNFGTADFSAALTTMNGSSANLTTGSAAPITMVNQADQTIAVPSAIGSDNESFSVTQ
jgi:hypothetical protein